MNNSFWLIFVGMFLVFSVTAIDRYLNLKGARLIIKVPSILLLASALALAVALLSPFFRYVFDSVLNTPSNSSLQARDSSQLAIAIISVVVALLVGYTTYVLTNFESKREKVENQIRNLERDTDIYVKQLREMNETYKPSLEAVKRTNLVNQFLLSRISSFLYVVNEIDDLHRDDTDDERRWKSLKLVQQMLSRNNLEDIKFDLDEIKAILHDRQHCREFEGVMTEPVQDYLISLKPYYKQLAEQGKYKDELVQSTANLVENIIVMLRG